MPRLEGESFPNMNVRCNHGHHLWHIYENNSLCMQQIPPWDDDRDLHEWLELEAEAVRAERAKHERAAAQATARLREAERRYEQYVISKQQEEATVDAKSTQSRKSETTGNPRQDSSAVILVYGARKHTFL